MTQTQRQVQSKERAPHKNTNKKLQHATLSNRHNSDNTHIIAIVSIKEAKLECH